MKSDIEEILQMKTNTDATCLHLAVQSNNIQLVEYLLINTEIKLLIHEQVEPLGTCLHIAGTYSID